MQRMALGPTVVALRGKVAADSDPGRAAAFPAVGASATGHRGMPAGRQG